MSSADRWGRVEELFGALYERPLEERERALDAVDDPSLRAEVAALLSTHQELSSGDGDFLEALDSGRAAMLLEQSPSPLQNPSTIGRYRVVRRLGRGGMGIVYLAHDSRLDRPVAVKLLPSHLDADPAAVRRLGDEARAASALDHPHIETVYEIGETEDGRIYIAMAYYEGETLRERIGRGPMAVTEVIDLGAQLAEGLSAAHRGGIVHRDIKPENILLTKDGVLKIVDFGVAKIMKDQLASAGLPKGTAAYMSPEQTRGEVLDHRTDIWSLGVVLYEMLTGLRPFSSDGEALIHAIRHDSPRPLSDFRDDLPSGLGALIEKCLEKNREHRFESADTLAADLSARPRPRRRRAWIAAAAAIPAVLAAALLMRNGEEVSLPATADAAALGIAVLPFEVRGEDLGMWREGMVDLLSINLDGASDLRAIDSRTVLAGWREAVKEGGEPDLAGSLEIARGTGARYAIIGSVVSSGSGMRLGAHIYELRDGRSLASLQVEGPPDSLFTLVDRLSIDILASIWQGKERPGANVDLTRITTTSLPALKAYLEGESFLRRADFPGAISAYERAIAADSTFAFALYHLGLAYSWAGDAANMMPPFRRALRHGGRLPEREALLLRAALEHHTSTHEVASIGLLREAARKYPDDVEAWFLLGESYFHIGEQVLADQAESEKAFRKAVELDPGFSLAYIHLVNNAFIHRPDSARAAHLIDTYQRLAPDSPFNQENRVAFGLAFGDSTHHAQAFAALDTLPPGSLVNFAWMYLDHPRFWAEREAMLDRPRPRTPIGSILTFYLFDTTLSRGQLRSALAHLEDPMMHIGIRSGGLYTIHSAGLPVAGEVLNRALALPRAGSPVDIGSTLMWFYAGAYAADQGRWEDHAAALVRLHALSNQLLAQGDSLDSRLTTGATLALKGQGLWRRGDARRALPLLVDAQRQATYGASERREALNDTIRWWLGELLLEMGRPEEAAVYFESFWNNPLAAYRLGPIYERIGDHTKARGAYTLVAFAWQDADPELRQRVQESRAAARRLTRSPGE